MPKHYRPPGKQIQGSAAKFITRTKALRYLQVSLQDFRKLCILKGIFPHEPKKKFEGNLKTYYRTKDIAFLSHEPLLSKLRDIRAYKHKINKALGKKNNDLAQQLTTRSPSYKLDRIIKERYPSFIDALNDMSDCLEMVHLFAALPALQSEQIAVNRIHNCRRLAIEWQAYVSGTHSLEKVFATVKGITYQAEVQGQKIIWRSPHALQQIVSDDVDITVMLTFLEFYEALLAFVNFKLYHMMNVKYPPTLDPRMDTLEGLYTVSNDFVGDHGDQYLHYFESEMVTQLKEKPDVDGTESTSHKSLFKNMKFFLSREAAKKSLLFVIKAFSGAVSWEGDGAPFKESDESITHQIFDRPMVDHVYLGREYVQPQWVYDCVNKLIILPTDPYKFGRILPPHMSPFIDDEAEGYVEAGKIMSVDSKENLGKSCEWINEESMVGELKMPWQQYFHELETEVQEISSDKKLQLPKPAEINEVKSLPDPEQVAKDAVNMSLVVMPRKRRRFFEAMQICNQRKAAEASLLEERKKQAEASKCG